MKKDPKIIMDFIHNKNGKILNIEIYETNETKLTIQCSLGHEWKAAWTNLQKGKWCPSCAGNKKLDITYALEIAKNKQAKLLSDSYVNSGSKLDWECKFGHKFSMNINSINFRGHWCPYCSMWSSEEICRAYFEQIFKMSFLKIRPIWLLNSRNNKMELDGLSQFKINDIFIAFEHNGEQHYNKSINIGSTNYHSTHSLEQRIIDDNEKKRLCVLNNVHLISIPQLFNRTKLKNLSELIKKEMQGLININDYDFNASVFLDYIYTSDIKFNNIKVFIENKNGLLLSTNYVNSQTKLLVKCENGHEFMACSNNLKMGSWCPICSKNKKLTIEQMIELAISKGGQCLSERYINSTTHLLWECGSCFHQWEAVPSSIKNLNTWCPACARLKRNKC